MRGSGRGVGNFYWWCESVIHFTGRAALEHLTVTPLKKFLASCDAVLLRCCPPVLSKIPRWGFIRGFPITTAAKNRLGVEFMLMRQVSYRTIETRPGTDLVHSRTKNKIIGKSRTKTTIADVEIGVPLIDNS